MSQLSEKLPVRTKASPGELTAPLPVEATALPAQEFLTLRGKPMSGLFQDTPGVAVGLLLDLPDLTLDFLLEGLEQLDVAHGYRTPNRIKTAITNPRMTKVSGIASMTMMIPRNSGFSAIVPAPAEPIRDWTQAVANAERPMASAAASAIRTRSMVSLLLCGER